MFGYIPTQERCLIKAFYEENYLYPMKEEINWRDVNTVKKLQESVSTHRTDRYSKAIPLKTLKHKAENRMLDFPNNRLYIYLSDFEDIDNICKRIEKGNYSVLILNLTRNFGGRIQKMLQLARLLITTPVELCLRYRLGERTYGIHGNFGIGGKYVCVLTGNNTVSCAEILAYIIKEGNPNSFLIGTKPYGKSEGQVTRISLKYKYMFCLTAYEWMVNRLTCGQLQEKYKDHFDNKSADISDYLEMFEERISAREKSPYRLLGRK